MNSALTPEEWAQAFGRLDWQDGRGPYESAMQSATAALCYTDVPSERRRHALAAFSLHGQPFGFTREDAKTLREANRAFWSVHHEFCLGGDRCNCSALVDAAANLQARIEALLPPEEFAP